MKNRRCMTSCMNVVETKEVCRVRRVWRGIVQSIEINANCIAHSGRLCMA